MNDSQDKDVLRSEVFKQMIVKMKCIKERSVETNDSQDKDVLRSEVLKRMIVKIKMY